MRRRVPPVSYYLTILVESSTAGEDSGIILVVVDAATAGSE